MGSESRPIRFGFDYISSNAYLAWKVLPELLAKYGATLEPIPLLFAGLLEAHGQLGPAEVPAKALWMAKNNVRKAVLLGLPLNPPVHHPFNPLLALRVSSLPLEPAARDALVDGLFDAVWVHRQHVSEPAVVERVANDAGLDGEQLIAEAQTPESKAGLRKQTDDAIARGVFGVPSMEFGAELFWGYDDLPYLEMALAGKDPLSPAAASNWSQQPPTASARRRRFRTGDGPV
jgi:2-hydroxychromene-2-carboxylate isomerase